MLPIWEFQTQMYALLGPVRPVPRDAGRGRPGVPGAGAGQPAAGGRGHARRGGRRRPAVGARGEPVLGGAVDAATARALHAQVALRGGEGGRGAAGPGRCRSPARRCAHVVGSGARRRQTKTRSY